MRNLVITISIFSSGFIKGLNETINKQSRRTKKVLVLVFGLCATGVSATLIIQALRNQEIKMHFKPEQLAMPYDIFRDEESTVSENQLTPVGKMKGEIDGEFESFYVAVDSKGSIYINRDIEYAESAYDKTEGWLQISRKRLMEYEKELDFIPSQSRGIRR